MMFRKCIPILAAVVVLLLGAVNVLRTAHILIDHAHHHHHHGHEHHEHDEHHDECEICKWAVLPFVSEEESKLEFVNLPSFALHVPCLPTVHSSFDLDRPSGRGPPAIG
jgi:ABC-type nickel/cobalt efflux system permease component RcnA